MGDEELTLILKLRDEATAQMKKAQAGIGGSVKKIAKVAAAAALVIGAAVGAAGVKLFKLASDAEEADNVIGLAFGSMKQQAIDWSETFAKATGSSKFESRELAADLGLIIRGMGFTEEATLGMSTQMVELAADMSSAKNVPLAEALDKIRAGLIGESEPLRTMGVLLSEARVKEEAYASGLAKTGATLTTTQKVQARMNIILADSVAMHGDLINTQDSAANQWRAIQNAVKDNLTTLGQHFMPVFVKVLGWMRKGVNFVIDFTKSLYASGQETSRWTKLLDSVKFILGVVWAVLKPLVVLLKDGLVWVIKTLVMPVITGMVDNFNTLIANLQKGYNWVARLIPGMKEIGVVGLKTAGEVKTLSTETKDLSAALSGGGDSLVVSLEDTATAAADTATAVADAAEDMRLAKRQFLHDAVIARNEAKVEALKIEQEEAAAVAVVLEALRLQKRQFIHDAVIARNELKVENLEIEQSEADEIAALRQEEADAAAEAAKAAAEAWGSKYFGALRSAFEGGGGFMGALKSQVAGGFESLFSATGDESGGKFMDSMREKFKALGGIPLVGPLLSAFGPALLAGIGKLAGKAWGAIKSLFGGPSEQEQLGRDMFANFNAGIDPELKKTEAYTTEVQAAIAAGWDRTLAETAVAFKRTAVAAGLTADEGFAAYEKYQNAVGAGNTTLMKKLEADYAAWQRMAAETAGENTAAFAESTDVIVHDAAEIGKQFQGLSTEEAAQLGAALLDLGAKANFGFTQIHDSARATGAMLANVLIPQIHAVSRAIRDMPSMPGMEIPARQHGGPVSAGRPYLVGEAGPEVFMPSSSGSVASNKSLPTAEEIGAAVAAALHRVPLVVPQDAVTDSILRRTPNRQAFRGWA